MNRRCLKFHHNLGRHDFRWDSFFNQSDVNFFVKLGICLSLQYIFEENFNRLFVQVCHIIGLIFVNFMLIFYFQPKHFCKKFLSHHFLTNSMSTLCFILTLLVLYILNDLIYRWIYFQAIKMENGIFRHTRLEQGAQINRLFSMQQ